MKESMILFSWTYQHQYKIYELMDLGMDDISLPSWQRCTAYCSLSHECHSHKSMDLEPIVEESTN